ncbi:hypothetical protein C8A05DRAFT_19630 [Staphylotrichum tortipilum]|uniref:Transmembrane protein n=1 Tax=Staphylotrichum tortipilum TaxID=2831512 RepID=A0AAN6MC45_9PEZI|nr:hypothetical protein C8A05DRAFT_19630 [Staphylotrichum longicolle]
MADPTTTKEEGPGPAPILGPAPPLTPASPYTPSPLTPTGTRPRLGPRRQSRFTEDMTERTPAASISERSLERSWHGPSAEDVNTNTNNTHTFPTPNPSPPPPPVETQLGARRTWVRVLNGVLHAVPCSVLLGILGYAMRVLKEDAGGYMSIEAVILICVLSADVLLDAVTLLRARSPWPSWGWVLRLLCGLAYIALFLVYVGMGGPFPKGYTYWGVSTRFAAPVVYMLLCVEGVWNLLHIPACLYHFRSGTLLRRTSQTTFTTSPTSKHRTTTATTNPANPNHLSNRRTSFATHHRFSVAGTENSSISLTWRRWVRTRSTQSTLGRDDDIETGFYHWRPTDQQHQGPSSADLTLRELPGKEEEGGGDFGEGASSRGGSSHGEKGGEGGGKWDSKEGEEGRDGGRFVRGSDVGQ